MSRSARVTSANRPIYVALAVTVDGTRDILGLWAGEHGDGEGAKYWPRVLSEIKNRGVGDVCIVVCDGLKGLPDAVGQVWPEDDRANVHRSLAARQLPLRLPQGLERDRQGSQSRSAPPPASRPPWTGSPSSARSGQARYPAIVRLWTNAWAEFVPFLRFDTEIRTIICTTNAIESINARIRGAVNARGHFPTEQAALKCVYLAITSLDPTGTGRKRWSNRWKKALNAFEITFDGRLSAGRK
jgi:transposase-like protein